MNSPRTKNIALMGLSANPPTGASGHLGIWRSVFLQTVLLIDELWILPVFRHIYESKQMNVSFEDRLRMCAYMLEDAPELQERAKVLDLERVLFIAQEAQDKAYKSSLGSIDLIRFLKIKEPKMNFTLVLGEDALADLTAGKWKQGEELLRLVTILLIPRKYNATRLSLDELLARAQDIGAQIFVADKLEKELTEKGMLTNSTRVREAKSSVEIESLLSPSVFRYIKEHQLYPWACT